MEWVVTYSVQKYYDEYDKSSVATQMETKTLLQEWEKALKRLVSEHLLILKWHS